MRAPRGFVLAALLAGVVGLVAASRAAAQAIPPLTEPVNDFANVIDASSRATLDRIIRSLRQENWAVSSKLRKALPQIFQEGGAFFDLHEQIIGVVRAAFDPEGESPE